MSNDIPPMKLLTRASRKSR